MLPMLIVVGCGEPASQLPGRAGDVSVGLYLGQRPPGLQAEIFAPGIVSDPRYMEWCGTFSPDGTEYYFYRYFGDSPSRIFATRLVNGEWTSPEACTFTGGFSAGEPQLTYDNRILYFNWKKSAQAQSDPAAVPEYYFVERTGDGWSEPQYAGQGMFMSSSRDGDLYTTDMSDRATTGKTYLAKLRTEGGVFEGYERVQVRPYYGSQAHPGVAPDGSYLLFDVDGGSHLFVTFKQSDGTWGEGIDLTKHGFDPLAGGGYVSPDGKYVFFALKDDIWWVDAQVIQSLRADLQP